MIPLDDLDRAADLLDQAADAATPGPWTTPGPDSIAQWTIYDSEWSIASATAYDHNNVLSNRPGARGPGYIDPDANAHLIAMMGPDAARALAEALRGEVENFYIFSPDYALAAWADDITRRILETQ